MTKRLIVAVVLAFCGGCAHAKLAWEQYVPIAVAAKDRYTVRVDNGAPVQLHVTCHEVSLRQSRCVARIPHLTPGTHHLSVSLEGEPEAADVVVTVASRWQRVFLVWKR